jgi:hypothetical protein
MKQIVIIGEESHGTIGAASNFYKAKLFLLESGWLGEHTDFWDDKERDWKSPSELFGENWQEEILAQDEGFFEGNFYFREMDFME